MRTKKIEVFKDENDETRVRVRAGNGEKLFISEGYTNPTYARKLADNMKRFGGENTTIVDTTKKKKK